MFVNGQKIEFAYNGSLRQGTIDERGTDERAVTIRLRRPQFEKRSGRNLTHKKFIIDNIDGEVTIVDKFSS